MRRIAIVGCGGAGKSTLARALGSRLDLPVIHLDTHFWNTGWVETSAEQWTGIHARLVEGEEWIVDGNFGKTLEHRLELADTVLFLDFPRRVCIPSVLRRWWRYRSRTRPDLAPGCPEKIDFGFLRWIWDFPRRSRPQIIEALGRHGSRMRVEVLRSRRDVQRFLDEC